MPSPGRCTAPTRDAAPEPSGSEEPSEAFRPILEIENLSVAFPTNYKEFVAVKNVSLSIRKGEIFGIVGESGAGKSTIGVAIIQLLDYPGYIKSGSIRLDGEELIGKSDAELCRVRGRQIGSIFQDPQTALNPVLTIGFQLKRAIRLSTGMTGAQAKDRAIDLMNQVGIPDPEFRLRQYPHQFSGGMRQRIVIAIALSGNPKLVIADEPTTALDVSIQSEILTLFRKLCKERNVGVILITHDMAVINEVTERVAIMQGGVVVEQGQTEHIINDPKAPYTQALIRAVPRSDVKLNRFVLWHKNQVENEIKEDHRAIPGWFNSNYEDALPDPVLEVKNLSVAFQSKGLFPGRMKKAVKAVSDVSFQVARGEIFGIVGESGSGKSTIARVLCGLEKPNGGSIHYKGRNISGLLRRRDVRRHCLDMQMIFQDPFSSLDPRQSIASLIAEPMKVHNLVAPAAIPGIVHDVLERVGIDPGSASKLPHQFSGGQKQRISIARALVTRPRLLICDEPTSALDVSVQAQILNLLKNLRDDLGLTMIFISHDMAVIRQMCDRVIVMNSGVICESAQVDELFEKPVHAYTRHLLRLMPKFSLRTT